MLYGRLVMLVSEVPPSKNVTFVTLPSASAASAVIVTKAGGVKDAPFVGVVSVTAGGEFEPADGVYPRVRVGGFTVSSREANPRTVRAVTSFSERNTQPKFREASASQNCTSLTIPAPLQE
jgi:hypothetical protein